MKDLNLPLPPVRPASYALGREIYQAITSWTGTTSTCCWTGRPT